MDNLESPTKPNDQRRMSKSMTNFNSGKDMRGGPGWSLVKQISLSKSNRAEANRILEPKDQLINKVYTVDARGQKEISDILLKSKIKEGKLDNDDIVKINLGVAPKAPNPNKHTILKQQGKNLDQFFVDNPPMKQHGATMLTDQVFLGSEDTACDGNFIKNNYVSHIVNCNGTAIPNVFDPLVFNEKEVQDRLKETQQLNSKQIGQVKYFTVREWSEHKMDKLDDIDFVIKLFDFIEEAVNNYTSCLIVSQKNKCTTIAVGIVYCIVKYKWGVHKTLEYINAKKADIEITKNILKQLQIAERNVQRYFEVKALRRNWKIDKALMRGETYAESSTSFDSKILGQVSLPNGSLLKNSSVVATDDYSNKVINFQSVEMQHLAKTLRKDELNDNEQVVIEEEASLINNYLNSIKLVKEDVNKDLNNAAGQAKKKTMKELIAEALIEKEKKEELLKKVLNWKALDYQLPERQRDKLRYIQFEQMHYSNKKPKFNPNKKNDRGNAYLKQVSLINKKQQLKNLDIINEHSREETQSQSNNKQRKQRAIKFQKADRKLDLRPGDSKQDERESSVDLSPREMAAIGTRSRSKEQAQGHSEATQQVSARTLNKLSSSDLVRFGPSPVIKIAELDNLKAIGSKAQKVEPKGQVVNSGTKPPQEAKAAPNRQIASLRQATQTIAQRKANPNQIQAESLNNQSKSGEKASHAGLLKNYTQITINTKTTTQTSQIDKSNSLHKQFQNLRGRQQRRNELERDNSNDISKDFGDSNSNSNSKSSNNFGSLSQSRSAQRLQQQRTDLAPKQIVLIPKDSIRSAMESQLSHSIHKDSISIGRDDQNSYHREQSNMSINNSDMSLPKVQNLNLAYQGQQRSNSNRFLPLKNLKYDGEELSQIDSNEGGENTATDNLKKTDLLMKNEAQRSNNNTNNKQQLQGRQQVNGKQGNKNRKQAEKDQNDFLKLIKSAEEGSISVGSKESLRQGESSDMISKDLDVKELARLGSERRPQEREDMSTPSHKSHAQPQRRSSTLMKIEFRSFQDALVETKGTEKANITEATPMQAKQNRGRQHMDNQSINQSTLKLSNQSDARQVGQTKTANNSPTQTSDLKKQFQDIRGIKQQVRPSKPLVLTQAAAEPRQQNGSAPPKKELPDLKQTPIQLSKVNVADPKTQQITELQKQQIIERKRQQLIIQQRAAAAVKTQRIDNSLLEEAKTPLNLHQKSASVRIDKNGGEQNYQSARIIQNQSQLPMIPGIQSSKKSKPNLQLDQVTPQKPIDLKQSHSVQAMARQQQSELIMLNQEFKREGQVKQLDEMVQRGSSKQGNERANQLKSQMKDPYHLNPLENTPQIKQRAKVAEKNRAAYSYNIQIIGSTEQKQADVKQRAAQNANTQRQAAAKPGEQGVDVRVHVQKRPTQLLNTINRNDKKAKAQTLPVSPATRPKQAAPREADADDEDYITKAKMAQKWDKHKQQREKEAAAKPKNTPQTKK